MKETFEFMKKLILDRVNACEDIKVSEEDIKYLYDGYTSDDEEELVLIRDTNIRYNGIEFDVVSGDYIVAEVHFLKEDSNLSLSSVRFDLETVKEINEKQGVDAVVKWIDDDINLVRQSSQSDAFDLIDNYQAVKGKLFIRLLNYTDNKYALNKTVYKQFGDIALVLYAKAYEDKDNLSSFKVPKEVFEKWEKTFDEVFDEAIINTNVMFPPRLYKTPKDCTNPPYHRGAFMSFNSDITTIGKLSSPTLTTTRQLNGATALFYPGVQEKLAKLAGGDYYVSFTSIHEARIHVKGGSMRPRDILRALKSVNSHPELADILSRKVYEYNSEKKELIQLEL